MGKIDCQNWIQSGQSIKEVRQSLDLALEMDQNGFLPMGCFNSSLGMEVYRCLCF